MILPDLKPHPGTIYCTGKERVRRVGKVFRADKMVAPNHQRGADLATFEEAEAWLKTI